MHPWMQKEQTVYPNRIPPDGLTIPFVKKALSLSIPYARVTTGKGESDGLRGDSLAPPQLWHYLYHLLRDAISCRMGSLHDKQKTKEAQQGPRRLFPRSGTPLQYYHNGGGIRNGAAFILSSYLPGERSTASH